MLASPRLITDLTCALPASAWTDAESNIHKPLSPPGRPCWRVLDYRSRPYDGRLLQAGDPAAPPLTIPLQASGWHALSIGLSERQFGLCAVEVRLTGDDHWQLLLAKDGPLHEEPWRMADLTGRDLEVRYPQNLASIPQALRDRGFCARLYSIRLQPLPAAHQAALEQRRHRPLVYINDGHGIFAHADKPGPHIVAEALSPFAAGDWDVCCFCHGGADLVNYPSRVGALQYEQAWDLIRPGDVAARDHLAAMVAAGEDPLRQAIDLAHEQGQDFWQYIRPQAWAADPEFGNGFRSPFYSAHPEFRCLEASGMAISKLSIAYPPVRHQLNAILAEGLERGSDGVCLVFVRGYPLVRYEQPVLDRFQAKYGSDARHVPDSDPRLRTIWAEFVMQWLREVRQLLDAADTSARRRRRRLAVMTGPALEWNLRFGIDVAALAGQGLVDCVLPYPYGTETTTGFINVAEYAQVLAGTKVELLPSLGSWGDHLLPLARIRQRAHQFYQQGATGLSRWDTDAFLARVGLDDPLLQQLWCEHYLGPQNIEVTEVAGISLEAFGPMLGF